ncbi:MAG: hypothetical protein H0W34_07575 [Pyrinomonadaceae bacterium]|nr:hypothetical protein [Pyrinomonadaceae bacterium]
MTKGPGSFAIALAVVPNVRFLVIGWGAMRNVQRIAADAGEQAPTANSCRPVISIKNTASLRYTFRAASGLT